MGISYRPDNNNSRKNGFILMGLMVVVLEIFTSALNFFKINSTASLGFEMKAYQRDVDNLRNDNQKMKVMIAESSSLKTIGDSALAEKMNLVNSTDYQYLTIAPSASLAKR